MVEIYSKINKQKVLHIVFHQDDIDYGRVDYTTSDQLLQVSSVKIEDGKSFKPHYHIEKDVNIKNPKAQECWVVLSGKISVTYYDIDNTKICDVILKSGDCSISLDGGHGFICLEEGSKIIEIKTGPYLGVEKDKKFI